MGGDVTKWAHKTNINLLYLLKRRRRGKLKKHHKWKIRLKEANPKFSRVYAIS